MKPRKHSKPAVLENDDLIVEHLRARVSYAPQHKRPLTALNRLVEVFFQQPADGLGREPMARQGSRHKKVPERLFFIVRARGVDHPI